MRAAIYARYSSDLQDPRSLVDQVATCRERARREGWTVVAEFTDAAISGASMGNRKGVQDLIRGATAGHFDAVLTESLDRLARDIEDLAHIHKRLTHHGVRIVTLADGEVGTLHVGLRGIVGKLYLEDLAQKTRRGLIGRVRAGKSPGGRTYGYSTVAGAFEIVPEQAQIVQRIFREYCEGRSPLSIVADLNLEGIPSPSGGKWSASTINGSRKRANGVIGNRLYVGEMTFGRQRNVKDPVTGKCQKRLCPEHEWLVQPMPELAIVETEVFNAAQERRKASCQIRLTHRRRPKHIFSGLVVCGACGASMIMTNKLRLACSARVNKRTCAQARTISLSEIEGRVLSALQERLLAPEVVAEAVEAYRAERARLGTVWAKAGREHARELAAVRRKIDAVVGAIANGYPAKALLSKLRALEAEESAVLARAPNPIEDATLALHPSASQRFRQKVEQIRSALTDGDEAGREAVALVRGLIGRIIVTPTNAKEFSLTIEGDLSIMLRQEPTVNGKSAVLVPPPRIERGTSRSTI